MANGEIVASQEEDEDQVIEVKDERESSATSQISVSDSARK
jgi:hypothetical protein